MSPILLIMSDWAYLLLRLTLGVVVVRSGWDKWQKTHLIGLLDIVAGLCLFLGLVTPWVAAIVALEMAGHLITKLYRHRRLHRELPFDLLLLAVCLLVITRGAGDFWALDLWLAF